MTTPDVSRSPVTVIGLGLMGTALAAALLRDGHPTTVWNRSAGKAADVVAGGAALADSVTEAISASPLVIICVTDYDAVHALLDPEREALAGRVLVNLTTGTSTQARETAEWAAEHGIHYLDGAIMAIPPDIGTAAAMVLYSGPRSAFEPHEGTFAALGTTTYLDADHGLSALYDMALLSIMWGVLNSFLHGAALLGTAGVKATAFAPLANTMIGVVTEYVTAYAPQVDAREYPADDATIAIHLGGIDHLVHESEALGVNAELPRLAKLLVERAVADGHAGSGYAALFEQFTRN
ncbi:NAD(P)-dependent oxidoreductase [Actinokineospora globicatena]|uniref:3-hydroxyisobutyrate dehydrogenase n=1 Tax=Actinokineospora globicatena TaxID=103729 RepID=A0A9W6QLA7_9PSEU|nr:NAD(P)-binding domain-containing protein [Actinokineospora globicatena]GLW90594.1 3-hydroxyisobutyrate dehydrogenase [Actinokineospora globicatena]